MLDPLLINALFLVLGVLSLIAIGISAWATYDNIVDYRIAQRRNPMLIPVAKVRVFRDVIPIVVGTFLFALSSAIIFETRRELIILALFVSIFAYPSVIIVYGGYDRYIRRKKMFEIRTRFLSTIDEDRC